MKSDAQKVNLQSVHFEYIHTYITFIYPQIYSVALKANISEIEENKELINPFAPGDFAEKRVLKLVEWFSGHCRAIKS